MTTIRPLAPAEVADVSRLLAEAFDDDPPYRFLFQTEAARRRGLADFFVRNLRTHLPYRCTFVAVEGARVLGTVTVRPPGGVPISVGTMVRHGLLAFAWLNGPTVVGRLLTVKRTYDEIEAHLAPGTHRLVHMMAVSRSLQGRGIGTELLTEAIRLAVAATGGEPLPIFLTTHTERAVTFYRRSGFDVVDHRDVSLGNAPSYTLWAMNKRE